MTESWSLPGKLSVDPQNLERLRELTRKIGERLQRETDAISHGMTAEIAAAVGELDDRAMRDALHSSVTDNVEVMIDQLAHSKEVSDLPSLPHAHRYAEELARQDVPESSLRRAYHVGSHYLLARIFDQVQEIDCPPHEQPPLYRHLAGWLYQYIDAITRQVIATYQEEQRSSHERAARTTFTWVNRVLEAEDVSPREFSAATKYRLDQVHVACRVWVDDRADQPAHTPALAPLIDQVRAMLGVRDDPLVVVTGRREADVWFGGVHRVDTRAFDSVVASAGGYRLAFGSPGFGPDGFRASRSQAHQASRIAHVASDPTARVTSYADEGIPVISRLIDDLPATRAWVHDVLGELAVDSDAAARQRDTVRVFLESAFSYSATASQLMLHRNSIRYRLEKASLQLGRGVADKPLDTQLALALCRVLGSVVLVPESRPGTAGASSPARE
ncbi:DNA-binding PucR family transcriptional regulator [Rhodococcus percolatus]|uniref:PucR family transcriptional regulator n=2 Tax=Rhodococcus opacus TaxID=37919 RepID=UPI0015FE5F71|nr:helix-turn-helix domain-containing protein [Rhodococcus opacus]MBP2206679.1 DNA-binding PucR family transcriptional regulator [Rhodococcus opacus]